MNRSATKRKVCKANKEIPGLPEGKYDRDAIFSELVKR